MRSRVLHCSRIASGNSLIHDRTGVRSDDVIPHPPQRTRPNKAGFAAFGRYAPACRRHGRGSPQLVVALGTRQRGSPDGNGPVGETGRHASLRTRKLGVQFPHRARRRSLHTVLSAQIILPARASTGKDRTCRTRCGFLRPMVPQRFARGIPPNCQSVPHQWSWVRIPFPTSNDGIAQW